MRSLYLTLKTTPFRLFLQSLLTERVDFSDRASILVVPKRFLQRISILSVYTAQNNKYFIAVHQVIFSGKLKQGLIMCQSLCLRIIDLASAKSRPDSKKSVTSIEGFSFSNSGCYIHQFLRKSVSHYSSVLLPEIMNPSATRYTRSLQKLLPPVVLSTTINA